MARVKTKGFKKVRLMLDKLGDNLSDGMEKHVDKEVDRLVRAIKKEIGRQGLRDDPTDKPEQIALRASIKKVEGGTEWVVGSIAPHASAIEHGSKDHIIRPRNASILAFQPDNPAKYEGNPAYDPDSGYVFTDFVDHPGNDAYNYMQNAQISWYFDLRVNLRNAVRQEIMRAGFVFPTA
jgi:hypothetical protein